jgi:hypothetical protein
LRLPHPLPLLLQVCPPTSSQLLLLPRRRFHALPLHLPLLLPLQRWQDWWLTMMTMTTKTRL